MIPTRVIDMACTLPPTGTEGPRRFVGLVGPVATWAILASGGGPPHRLRGGWSTGPRVSDGITVEDLEPRRWCVAPDVDAAAPAPGPAGPSGHDPSWWPRRPQATPRVTAERD